MMDFRFKSPLKAVLMRRLAFEAFVAGRRFDFAEIWSEHLPAARHELGLPPHEYSESAMTALLSGLLKRPVQLRQHGDGVRPVDAWAGQWRLHRVPPHDEVRRLSLNPAVRKEMFGSAGHRRWTMVFRDTALPKLTVITGPLDSVKKACDGLCGVYVMRRARLYIGHSTNLGARFLSHLSAGEPQWTVAVAPASSDDKVDDDVLRVAETLLTSLWGEVALLANAKSPSNIPRSEHLQQGVLLAKAAAAAVHWLKRHDADLGLPALEIPFIHWRVPGWPACYLEPQETPIVRDHGEWPKSGWDLIFASGDEEEDDPDLPDAYEWGIDLTGLAHRGIIDEAEHQAASAAGREAVEALPEEARSYERYRAGCAACARVLGPKWKMRKEDAGEEDDWDLS